MRLEQLVSSLAASFEAGTPIFVLVDPMLGEPIVVDSQDAGDMPSLMRARDSAWKRQTYAVALAPGIALPPHLHPYLVELQGRADAWLGETLRIALQERDAAQADGLGGPGAAPHRIGGWLQSSLSAGEVTQALSRMMKVNTQAFTQARYQRLADRRALGWLRWVAGDARFAAQLGRIQSWSYVDACGELARLQSAGETTTPLHLTSGEWAAFMQGELLHPTVARWLGASEARPGPTHPHDAATAYRRAATALEQVDAAARRWPHRFASSADRVAWAVLALLHPDIGQGHDIATVLDAAPEPSEPIETLNALSPMLDALCLKANS